VIFPVLKGPVYAYPIPRGDPRKFEKAIAWAQENTGTDKSAVEADLMVELKKEIPMPLTPEEKTRRKRAKARKKKQG
jgi:hypothetical protein